LNYRLGTVNGFHWGFKPVLNYITSYTFSTLFGEKAGLYNTNEVLNSQGDTPNGCLELIAYTRSKKKTALFIP